MSKERRKEKEVHGKKSRIIKGLWFTAGTISLVLGAVGIVLPILPTTPFLLATAACYYKSSSRMHKWLINNKLFGEYIRNYQEGKGIPLKTKVTALTVLWITIGISTFFFLERLLPSFLLLPIQITMISIAAIITIYLIKLPTYKKK